jgi:hypothetical protein
MEDPRNMKMADTIRKQKGMEESSKGVHCPRGVVAS